MKTPTAHRLFSLSAHVLLALPLLASAAESRDADAAGQLLVRTGRVAVTTVGNAVQPGAYQVHVTAKLGRPDARLGDGTWLYHHRRVEGSAAEGTLVVHFAVGRVSSLELVTPAVATALCAALPRPAAKELLAQK